MQVADLWKITRTSNAARRALLSHSESVTPGSVCTAPTDDVTESDEPASITPQAIAENHQLKEPEGTVFATSGHEALMMGDDTHLWEPWDEVLAPLTVEPRKTVGHISEY